MEKKKKTGWWIAGIALFLVIGIVVSMLGFSADPQKRIQRQMDLGERYLTELEYEQAVAAYQAVIEIDPQRKEAYLGLAEAYVGLGDYGSSEQVLKSGYEQTGDDAVRAALAELYLDWAEELLASGETDAQQQALELLQKGYEETGDERLAQRIAELQPEDPILEVEGVVNEFTWQMIPKDVWEADGISIETPIYWISFEGGLSVELEGENQVISEAGIYSWPGIELPGEDTLGVPGIYRGKIEKNDRKMDGLIEDGLYRYDPYDYIFELELVGAE